MTTQDDEITQLRAELASIRSELASMKGSGPRPLPAGRISRAGLLRAASLAAAGAAAGAVTLPSAEPALADNGSNLVAGQDNQATATTSLTSSVLTDAALRVSNYYTGAVDDYSDALQAYTYGAGLAGLYGRNDAAGGSGVIGYSGSGVGGTFAGGLAPIRLQPASAAGAPTSFNHRQGELYVDANGSLWLCTATGSSTTPGTWAEVSGVGMAVAGGTVPLNPPPSVASGGWSWSVQGAATAADAGTGILMTGDASNAQMSILYRAETLIPPWSVVVGLFPVIYPGQNTLAVMALVDSVSGKAVTFGLEGGGTSLIVGRWNANSAWSSNPATFGAGFQNYAAPLLFLKISDDGTTRRYWVSADGYAWTQAYSEASGTWAVPNAVGFGTACQPGKPALARLVHLQVTNP